MKYDKADTQQFDRLSPSSRREWIEIKIIRGHPGRVPSPSSRREWIEISCSASGGRFICGGLPPRGGSGLKWDQQGDAVLCIASPSSRREWIEMMTGMTSSDSPASLPPRGGSGLKCLLLLFADTLGVCLPPRGGSGLKSKIKMAFVPAFPRLPPRGGSGLKCRSGRCRRPCFSSPSSRREWIEIFQPQRMMYWPSCLPPRGGSGLKYIYVVKIVLGALVSLLAEGVD